MPGKPERRNYIDLETGLPYIGGITLTSLPQATKLADVVTSILKTLLDFDVLGDEFEDGRDLDSLVEDLENLGAEW